VSRSSRPAFIALAAFLTVCIGARAESADRGEYVASAANCAACHTAPGEAAYAGGLKMATPMGAIYVTNITPDARTGIGSYSLKEFDRAVRRGVAKDGHHLYPAMPYPSYAKMSDEDISALYLYFKSGVKPVERANTPGEIKWPLNMRWPLALWNIAFGGKAFAPDPKFGAEEARGAYLVQGPGHCGACHTPRGIAFQEKGLDESSKHFLAGAPLDNWSSPNLRGGQRAGLGQWSDDDIVQFLKTGRNRFGSTFGTMIEVIDSSTQYLTDADLRAMAKYLKSLPADKDGGDPLYIYNGASVAALNAGKPVGNGALIYWQKCQSCHAADGLGQGAEIAALAGNPAVMDRDATSLINIVLNGSLPIVVSGTPDIYKMPQFRRVYDDKDIADIVSFMRSAWGNDAPPVSASDVASLRKSTDFVRYKSQILQMQ
jgi:mono/diheme cytochrome c family protein